MANSASDARNSEATIREKIIREKAVDVMISVWPNMFYNVTLPCTLWFFDKDKVNTDRKDTVLFINAKEIFRQVDRAHREFTDEQLEYITRIAQLYRWEKVDAFDSFIAMLKEIIKNDIEESKVLLDESKDKDEKKFLQTEISTLEERLTIADTLLESYNIQFNEWYDDVPGLCKVATLEEIESNSRSLNPWRYTWVASTEDEDFDFERTMTDYILSFKSWHVRLTR